MQHDEVIWQVINHGHCTFKVKTLKQNFCRNEYNVSGLCNRSSCPLANSRYATIREDRATGRLYLYMKTIERAHTPAKMWQKVRLASSYAKALEQVDEHLAHFPKFLVHKNKQRLTKITQYLIRARRLALRPRATVVPIATRTEQRERRRERKAEVAARLETSIEQELLERLRSGTYGDIYNFPEKEYEAVLDRAEEEMDHQEEGEHGDVASGGGRYVVGDSDDDEGGDEDELEWEGEYDDVGGSDGGELEEDSDGPEEPSDDEGRGGGHGGSRGRRRAGDDIEDLVSGPPSPSSSLAKRARGGKDAPGDAKGKGPATPARSSLSAKRARVGGGGDGDCGGGGSGSGRRAGGGGGGRREVEVEVEREGIRARR